jgi:hypothetical protein
MIRHPLLEVPCHSSQSLVVDRYVVGVHAEDLRPAFASCVFEIQVYVCEGLVDLCVDVLVEYARLRVPSAWRKSKVSAILSGAHIRTCRGQLTLPSTFNAVTDTDSLTIAMLSQVVLADAFVREILEVRHIPGCMSRCNQGVDICREELRRFALVQMVRKEVLHICM